VISDRLSYGRNVPFQWCHRERKRGRDLTWSLRGMPPPPWVTEDWPGNATILVVRCKGTRKGKAIDETHYYVTSLRTTAEMDMPMVAGRAASGINEAHLRRIVAGFPRLLPGMHTRAGGKARLVEAHDSTHGILLPETSAACQSQWHAEGRSHDPR
jgi:hypothetical protein